MEDHGIIHKIHTQHVGMSLLNHFNWFVVVNDAFNIHVLLNWQLKEIERGCCLPERNNYNKQQLMLSLTSCLLSISSLAVI